MKQIIAYCIPLLALLAITWFEQRVISQTQQQNQILKMTLSSVSPPVHDVNETEELHAAKRELAGLRNEVRQLRAKRPDPQRLRAENERLARKIAEVSQPQPAASPEQGFLLSGNWASAGMGSPE